MLHRIRRFEAAGSNTVQRIAPSKPLVRVSTLMGSLEHRWRFPMNFNSEQADRSKQAFIKTRVGVFVAYFSERGLARLEFPSGAKPEHNRRNNRGKSDANAIWVSLTSSALNRALAAETVKDLPPLDLTSGTDFQQSVWRVMLSIAPGKTMAYAEIAMAIRRPKATRAVGQACGANPIPVIIPCHRVLAAHGRLGGFSAGLDWKRRLLAIEGVRYKEITKSGSGASQ